MAGTVDVRLLTEHLVKNLVDSPDAVKVDAVEDEHGIEVQLQVAENDMGKVIGKQGRTARCLRNILGAAGVRAQKRCTLDILD